MILYECPGFLKVRYDEGKDYIAFAWDDFSISLKELAKAHDIALRFAVGRGCFRYIADCSRARDSLLPEVIVWWRSEWVPRMAAAGVRRIVTVAPSSTLAGLSNRDWQREIGSGMETINVDSLAKAESLLDR